MKNRKNNLLPFPKAPQELGTSTIVVQIGSERFAIHFEIEDLPPARSARRRERQDPKKQPSISSSNPLGRDFRTQRLALWHEKKECVCQGSVANNNADGNEIPSPPYTGRAGLAIR
jgi:hypothetical protein